MSVENAAQTAVLALAFLGRGVLVILAAIGAGSFWPRVAFLRARFAGPLAMRALVGLGIVGSVMTVLGVAGWWNRWAVTIAGSLLAVRGLAAVGHAWRGAAVWVERVSDGHEPNLVRLPANVRAARIAAFDRLGPLEWALVAVSAACAVNVLLGALAPDSQQDSLWYHLGCGRAWMEWGRIIAWPAVYPSNFSLLHSVIYATVLTAGEVVDCSVLYAATGFLCYTVAAAYANEWYGRRAAVWAWFLCATGHAAHTWFAPINTGSDLFVGAFSTAGLLLAIDEVVASPQRKARPLAHPGDAGGERLAAAGLLIGFALATKITTAGYILPVWLGLCAWHVWRRRAQWPFVLAAVGWTFLPYVPWAVRNAFLGCGNPFYPMAREWIPMRPGFEVINRLTNYNSVFPPTPAGFVEALRHFPATMEFMATAGSASFVIHAAMIAALFARRQPVLRVLGAAALFQWGVQFWITGHNEVARYLAQCYPAVFVGAAGVAAWFSARAPVARWIRMAALSAVAAVLAYGYFHKQAEWGAIPTNGWHYRPVLTPADRRAYLTARPCDLVNYPLYEWINANTPPESCVAMGDIAHAFYVERRCVLADESPNLFLQLAESGVTTTETATAWLASNGVDYVVGYKEGPAARPPWDAVLESVGTGGTSTPAGLFRPRRSVVQGMPR